MLKKTIIAFAILGYTVGYSSVYAFHVVSLLWVFVSFCLVCFRQSLIIKQPQLLSPVLFLAGYSFLSILWSPDIYVWFRYQFYFACGILTLLAVYQSVNNRHQIVNVFKIVSFFVCLNVLVGFFESLGLARLPMSPYSPYVGFFGFSGTDFSLLSDEAAEIVGYKPTGFNWNPNNFGFVLMLVLPFVLLHKNKLFASLGLVMIVWLLAAIGSRAHFIAFFVMFSCIPLLYKHSVAGLVAVFVLPLFLGLILLIPSYFLVENYGLLRMYSAFDEFSRGLDLIFSGAVQGGDSTSVRAEIYLFGLQKLIASYGLGLGVGGVEAMLIKEGFVITNFHFFFLQLLIDLGFVLFCFFMFLYFKLVTTLLRIAKRTLDRNMKYYARSSALSLMVAVPASMAPSGVHYILFFYVLIGFSLAIVKLDLSGGLDESGSSW
ncbi:hypothetical protein SAMN05216190_10117 [Pseudomonas borbori]|uniref:O-Antigen ligase n=1 Tax=Pseudomonas borbori TaxID=289003 RepID=A0A1I5K4F2_9PSED|nr:hypothetical protein SAMN05216190_10117 [Pseudomonas borbori]